ncbi:uncharacterized protein LOC108682049 [Hyalella azteca]|uniref:Uncharacterized protein LOC108682049 n=1 Tax=Hyalella azteca TaxID=294128 RepID=A0A8B7PMP2_HYAAZ|nr:uncharacterized protein LOC108682049 [Hyalella azteca]
MWTSSLLPILACVWALCASLAQPTSALSIDSLHGTTLDSFSRLSSDFGNQVFFNLGHPLQDTTSLSSSPLHGISLTGHKLHDTSFPIFPSSKTSLIHGSRDHDEKDDLPDARRAGRLALQLNRLALVDKEEHDNYIAAGASGGTKFPVHLKGAALHTKLPPAHALGGSFSSVHHDLGSGFDIDADDAGFGAAGWH